MVVDLRELSIRSTGKLCLIFSLCTEFLKIIFAIRLLYTDPKASVETSDGETDSFPIFAGIVQGGTVAPFLFILVVDYVMGMS